MVGCDKYVRNKEDVRNIKHYLKLDRKRDHRLITQIKCSTKVIVYLDYKSSLWRVSKFVETHNHELTRAYTS